MSDQPIDLVNELEVVRHNISRLNADEQIKNATHLETLDDLIRAAKKHGVAAREPEVEPITENGAYKVWWCCGGSSVGCVWSDRRGIQNAVFSNWVSSGLLREVNTKIIRWEALGDNNK